MEHKSSPPTEIPLQPLFGKRSFPEPSQGLFSLPSESSDDILEKIAERCKNFIKSFVNSSPSEKQKTLAEIKGLQTQKPLVYEYTPSEEAQAISWMNNSTFKKKKIYSLEELKHNESNSCQLCNEVGTEKMSKNSRMAKKGKIATLYQECYLRAPEEIMAIPEEFWLVPKSHVTGTNLLNSTEYKGTKEIMEFLVSYFKDKNKTMLFIEVASPPESNFHARVLCAAIANDSIERVKGCFMKELTNAVAGWADKDNLLDTEYKRGYMNQILQFDFPYIHVDIGGKGGMMKIIKYPNKFPSDFVGKTLREGLGIRKAPTGGKRKMKEMREELVAAWIEGRKKCLMSGVPMPKPY